MTPIVQSLIAIAAKGTIVLALTGLVAGALRRSSAATRHWVWTLGLAAVLVLPILTEMVPVLELPVLPQGLSVGREETPPLAATASTISVIVPVAAPVASVGNTTGPIRATPAPTERSSVWVGTTPAAKSSTPAPTAGIGVTSPGRGFSTATWLGLGWLVGVGLSLLWIVAGEWRVRRLGQLGEVEVGEEWSSLLDEAREAAGVGREVRLIELADDVVPMTYGWFRPVVVVPEEGRRWSEGHRFDVLVHELAHVARYDCLTYFLGRAARAFHWYNPLAWWATRQARIEREQACDDVVLEAGAVPSRYAEELLATATSMTRGPSLLAATTGLGMARRSTLTDRLLSVLDADRPRSSIGSNAAIMMGTVAAMLAVPISALVPTQPAPRAAATPRTPRAPRTPVATAAPRVWPAAAAAPTPFPIAAAVPTTPTPPRPPAPSIIVETPATMIDAAPEIAMAAARGSNGLSIIQPRGPIASLIGLFSQPPAQPCRVDPNGNRTVHLSSSMSITGEGNASDGKNSYVAWTGRNCTVMIKTTGTVTFNDDETDVASLSSGGRFTVTHVEGKVEKEYDVRSQGGSLVRKFTIDGEAAPEDQAFGGWRGSFVLAYIRRSGYDAEARVGRIYAKRGLDGVFQELDEISSDWTSGLYLRALLKRANLEGPTVTRIVDRSKQIDSDYELGQVLAAVPPRFLETESVKASFVAAAGTMESDYEMHKVLGTILGKGKPSATLATAMLELATKIDSDYELASLLTELAATGAVLPGNEPAYLTAVQSIESDFEKHRVLSALLAAGARSPATLRTAIEAARTIDSDFELATWLKEVVAASPLTDELRPGWFEAAGTIESDFELHGVLEAALQRKPTAAMVADILKQASRIDSDFELAGLLVSVANRGLLTTDLRPAFRRALATIESSFERQRVMAAVGERAAEI